jgi:hypothetical protein
LVWSLALVSGCSLVVDPEAKTPRCVVVEGKADPCPRGRICTNGRCEPRGCGRVELCGDGFDDDCDGKIDERIDDELEACGDRADNDCDGKVDERHDMNIPEICGNMLDDDCDTFFDEGHDQDGDMTPWCGNGAANGGDTRDCDDLDPTVYPGNTERCDGRDNDCDTRVDETTSEPLCDPGESCVDQRCTIFDCTLDGDECGPDQHCDSATLRCVPDGCTPDSCVAPARCDQASGECRTTRRTNGEPCVVNDDCMSGSCADRVALRLRSEAARLCVEACCSDADCRGGERCYVSGSGARSCLPGTLVPRPTNAPRPCVTDDECNALQICGLVSGQSLSSPSQPERNDLVAPSCKADSGQDLGSACATDSMCASGACVSGAGLFSLNVCSRTCGTSDDCDRLEQEANGIFQARPTSICRFVTKGPGQDYLPICVFPQTSGSGGFGAPCANGTACQEGACVGAAGERPGMCSVACCRDSDCPGLNGEPTLCRPVAFGEHFEMRCMP